jgi:D-alanyl-D-alanine dipeptidase
VLITSHTPTRELDHRNGDGIDVTLLWDPHADCISVAVIDERTGEVLTFGVDSADAVQAFHHPYAYAPGSPAAVRRAAASAASVGRCDRS